MNRLARHLSIASLTFLILCVAANGCSSESNHVIPGALPISACSKTTTHKGMDVYCCNFCTVPVTKMNVTAVGPSGDCVVFCDGCLASGYAVKSHCTTKGDARTAD